MKKYTKKNKIFFLIFDLPFLNNRKLDFKAN